MSLFPIIIGAFSYLHDENINKELRYNYEKQVLSIQYLYQLRYLSQETNNDLLNLIINKNLKNQDEMVKNINNRWIERDKIFSKYVKYTLDEYEKTLIPKLNNLFNKNKKYRLKILKLILEGKKAEAYEYYTNNKRTIFDYDKELDYITKYNVNQSKQNYLINQQRTIRDNLVNLGTIFLSLLFAIPLGLYIADLISKPLKELAEKMEKVSEGNFDIPPKKIPYKDEIGIISTAFYDMTDRLKRLVYSERTVKDIVFETRRYENHDQIFNFLLERLVDIYNVERALHLHYDEYKNLVVKNEVLNNKNAKSVVNTSLLLAKHTEELAPKIKGEVLVIEDVNTEIYDSELKEYLKNKGISSFLIYPLTKSNIIEETMSLSSLSMLCSPLARIWSPQEIEGFKLMVNTSNLVYIEAKQRKELEETKSTFLATLTHDLRSPIIAEQKALEVILSEKFGTSLENFSEYLHDIYKTNDELLRIVNNILSSYHYDSSKVALKSEYFDIKELVYDCVRAMMHLAKDQQCEITTEIQETLPEVEADKEEIKRVIINLMSNAIKHNKKGTAINISACLCDSEMKISVQDNGKGINDKEKPNIFQRYPTSKSAIGTGLGLYLSKQIIDAHKGKIWFISEEGKGTTFYFTLPVKNN